MQNGTQAVAEERTRAVDSQTRKHGRRLVKKENWKGKARGR